LFGNSGSDKIVAGFGDDVLSGNAGIDRLFGQNGRDVVDGGRGDDILNGGAGADRFVFRALDGHDSITDYVDGVDKIDLRSHNGVTGFGDLSIKGTAGGTLITIGIDSFLLKGVAAGIIEQTDFLM
jgi:Ca2+-binding RTX toxin-like protein